MVSIGTRLSWLRAASAWCLAVVVLFLAQGAASRLLAQGVQGYIPAYKFVIAGFTCLIMAGWYRILVGQLDPTQMLRA